MVIYSIEYCFETHHFYSFPRMMKMLKSWWVADGRPYWYDEHGRRSHFPTDEEVMQELENPDGFYREYGSSYYVAIRKIEVEQ